MLLMLWWRLCHERGGAPVRHVWDVVPAVPDVTIRRPARRPSCLPRLAELPGVLIAQAFHALALSLPPRSISVCLLCSHSLMAHPKRVLHANATKECLDDRVRTWSEATPPRALFRNDATSVSNSTTMLRFLCVTRVVISRMKAHPPSPYSRPFEAPPPLAL